MNRTILMGRITVDPELKTTPSGASVTNFSIAVDRGYVKQGEERQTDFFNIVAWRNTAEFICKYFSKGSMIALQGQLQNRAYVAKDGSNRHITEVVVTSAYFTGEKRDNNYTNATSGYIQPKEESSKSAQQAFTYASNSDDNYVEMPLDDDLPFKQGL